jgi:hypothetical protein
MRHFASPPVSCRSYGCGSLAAHLLPVFSIILLQIYFGAKIQQKITLQKNKQVGGEAYTDLLCEVLAC